MSSKAVLLFRMMSRTAEHSKRQSRAIRAGKRGRADQPERIPPELLVDVQSGCAEQGKTGENSQLFVKQ